MSTRDLNDLAYFVHVVDHGGFAPAGRALGVPKSKLSRRIALLEERLGTRLIHRSTRQFAVTEAGHTYYGHCKAMLVEAEAADDAIAQAQAEPRGVVRLSCPVLLLQAHVAGMLAEFMTLYPRVTVHLEESNRPVDLLGEGLDIALRVRPPPLEDSELVLRVLAESGQCLVASPQLLQGRRIQAPADLAQLPSLDLAVPQSEHSWTLRGPDGALVHVRHQPRLITRGMPALIEAARAGVGVVQLPTMAVRDLCGQGELVPLLADWAPRRELIHAVMVSRRGLLPAVRALLDFLAERFAALPPD